MKHAFLFAVLLLLANGNGLISAHHPSVFVDLDQLAQEHPAWKQAQNLRKRESRTIADSPFRSFFVLFPVPLSAGFADPQASQWSTDWELFWDKERAYLLNLLLRATQGSASSPETVQEEQDLRSAYQKTIEVIERQLPERAQLRLLLLLTRDEEKKEEIRKRLQQLDQEVQQAGRVTGRDKPSEPAGIHLLSLVADGITDVNAIDRLTEPMLLPLEASTYEKPVGATKVFGVADFANAKWLEQQARESSRRFALLEGLRIGVRVQFRPALGVLDATKDFLSAWRQWLSGKKLKAGEGYAPIGSPFSPPDRSDRRIHRGDRSGRSANLYRRGR
ncbi:MAG: hypothetical protein NZ959_10020 [Armatimonadetes bacterium]|nr:hypothetical protein [Armatimonadota bacterium]MDW8122819.1 hypothetical protein [Armatimonadota bacterium]